MSDQIERRSKSLGERLHVLMLTTFGMTRITHDVGDQSQGRQVKDVRSLHYFFKNFGCFFDRPKAKNKIATMRKIGKITFVSKKPSMTSAVLADC